MCCEISRGLCSGNTLTRGILRWEACENPFSFYLLPICGTTGPNLSNKDAERETYMAVTDSETLQRLRREETVAEQQGRQALNISVLLKEFPQYDAARGKADVLLAKAASLREQIIRIETI
jgi:hypothetical protein